MSYTSPTSNDEIDLVQLLSDIWKEKWKILFLSIITFLSVYFYQLFKPNTNFVATTQIKPITSVENDKYKLFNSHVSSIIGSNQTDKESTNNFKNTDNFFEITPNFLLNLFLEQVEEGTIFEEAIKRFELVNIDNYKNKKEYNDAIIKLASKIDLRVPSKVSKKGDKDFYSYHLIKFEFNDFAKWNNVLQFVAEKTNKRVKKIIHNRFQFSLKVANQTKKFKIEDIEYKIQNEIRIYDNVIKNRLAFLKEQASIARKLNIRNNTIETEFFNSQNSVVTNIKTDNPFYLRGYEAIEEEIKLTEKRVTKTDFIPELIELEDKIKNLENDRTTLRTAELFANTPISSDNFTAALIKVPSTSYKFLNRARLYYIMAIISGAIIGIVYVITSNAIKRRRTNTN